MSPLPRAAATLIVCALAAPGCFDVRLRAPGPLVIDDFEDGDYAPELPGFSMWQGYAINAQVATVDRRLAEGSLGSVVHGLSLDFKIDDPPDGKQQHGGAGLMTFGQASLDLSPYRTFVFSAKLASGTPALPSDALLYVELACSTAIAEDGSGRDDIYVVTGANYKSNWQQFRIDLTAFGFPPWNVNITAQGGPTRCREIVDGIHFAVDAQLVDGLSGEGILTIDDIRLE